MKNAFTGKEENRTISKQYKKGDQPYSLPLHLKWSAPRLVRDETTPYKARTLDCTGDPGFTDQSQAEETDVNKIVDRFMKTGILPGVDAQKVYGDFSNVPDYQDAMNLVIQANQQFDGLNARVRKRFNNDPAEFLAFVNDPTNANEMVKLGLATQHETPPSVGSPGPLKPESGKEVKASDNKV